MTRTRSAALALCLRVCAAMALIGLACMAGRVSAQAAKGDPSPPAQCTSKARHQDKFKNGVAAGKQRADNIFAAADVNKDPKKLKRKLNRVLDRLHDHVREVLSSDTSDGRRCRVQGVAEGFIKRLADLLGQCVLDGAQWAQFTANLYCELSIELDGLAGQGQFYRAPVGLCGDLFENVCDNGYAYIATEGATALKPRVEQFLSARSVTLVPYAGCAPYTLSPHDVTFEEAINFDCAYAPP